MNLSKKIYTFCSLYIFPITIFATNASETHSSSTGNVDYEKNLHRVTRATTKAEKMCETYTKKACISKRSISDEEPGSLLTIIGGTPAKPKQYPHAAEIGYSEGKEISWKCAGSLISEKFVMSAAHCTIGWTPDWVRFDEPPPTRVNYKIVQSITHPNFDKNKLLNDIVLFRIEGLKKFTDYIRPICLNVLCNIPLHKKVTAIGWGRTETKASSEILLAVDLEIHEDEQCSSKFKKGMYDNKACLCSGCLAGGKDSCNGDSGGPLQYLNENASCSKVPIYIQVGIVSYGNNPCGYQGWPAVYTRVSNYISWIEEHVWK